VLLAAAMTVHVVRTVVAPATPEPAGA
jgi:hypothetical protein